MTIKVLVVDDSGFFRRRLSELINADSRLEVIGTAVNGQEAVDQAARLKPDVITMDYEMPVMDGITAVRHIVQASRTPVLMFSSLTYEGARVTLDALEAGAVDYLPKNFEDISHHAEELQKILCERIVVVSRSRSRSAPAAIASAPAAAPAQAETRSFEPAASGRGNLRHAQLVIIGASTGGPMALQEVLTKLPDSFPLPILLVQHMPGTFTRAFAERLNRIARISIAEASDGDVLKPGHAYLAPGGKQMLVEGRSSLRVRVIDGDERLNYKPSLDVTFGSAARDLGNKVLGVVLTGMGSDGRDGARMLKTNGATIWAQDEESSVIYGMPMAVAKAGLVDEVLPLNKVAARLCQEIC
ncbi:chemotaxis response regulator protein-glutamate methylesterase [Pseudohongiella sp. SYSU M77423]|uniref:protein-glutamate methylesterase/protein-glutamine glutaminase n=1 Tax=Pseudohongiella sp. SYSU M77423 TaxID=3042312 RepID=UPI00248036B7|nr:chemotaxis response regulator protein-glutamate methylesterase [Pseudohongiella sp. SYSU M77423]MDH7942994.1 chemotaxis response regulator protein-glutamate methylesterase [Pseudohongiella sp. SYSU M77423]